MSRFDLGAVSGPSRPVSDAPAFKTSMRIRMHRAWQRQIMAIPADLARCMPAFDVFGARTRLKVSKSDAVTNAAQMIKIGFPVQGSIGLLPGVSMREMSSVFSVSIGEETAGEEQAWPKIRIVGWYWTFLRISLERKITDLRHRVSMCKCTAIVPLAHTLSQTARDVTRRVFYRTSFGDYFHIPNLHGIQEGF